MSSKFLSARLAQGNLGKMETTNESPTITVLRRDVEDIKDCLVQLSAKQESICSSDILQACSRVDGEAKCCNSEAKRVLTEKQDQMSFLLKFVLNKLEHILPTAASTGQVPNGPSPACCPFHVHAALVTFAALVRSHMRVCASVTVASSCS